MFNLNTPKAIALGYKVAATAINRELSHLAAEQAVKNETESDANQVRLIQLREKHTQRNAERAANVLELVADNATTPERMNYEANLLALGITK